MAISALKPSVSTWGGFMPEMPLWELGVDPGLDPAHAIDQARLAVAWEAARQPGNG